MAENNFFGVKKGLNIKPNTLPVSGNLGDIAFDSVSNSFKQWNGTNWSTITGGSGSKNFITGGDAEAGTTGFATYADAAGTRPVDGTGGSPTVTWTTSSSSPLADINSFLFTKDAANRQGQGTSYAFTIDPTYKAKVLQISFDYLVNSGTFVAGTSTTDSDVIVYLYDVTNGVLIEPSSIKLLSNNTTLTDKFNATFQTASNSTSYRLILHCATTSASAYSLKIDNIAVSPSTYVYGTPITDWVSWTPTGSWTGVTYSGKKRRVGDSMQYKVYVTMVGAPTGGNLVVNLPFGEVVDTTKMVTADYMEPVGTMRVDDSGGAIYQGTTRYNTTTSVAPVLYGATGTYVNDPSYVTTIVPMSFGSGDRVAMEITLPIVGLSSSVQTSDQTDTRVVSFRAGGTTSLMNDATTIFSTVNHDTHSAYNTSTGIYTVPISGKYKVYVQVNAPGTAGSYGVSNVVLNGVTIAAFTDARDTSRNSYEPRGSTILDCKTGDQIKCNTSQQAVGGSPAITNSTSSSYMSIERISGPNQIAATESINARYTSSAGQSISNGATPIVDFGTKVFDSHGAVTTGASWKFTAPIAGVYEINSRVRYTNNTAWAANSYASSLVYKNNALYAINGEVIVQAAFTNTNDGPAPMGLTSVKLLAGDYIDVRTAHNESTSRALLASDFHVFIEIKRVGN